MLSEAQLLQNKIKTIEFVINLDKYLDIAEPLEPS